MWQLHAAIEKEQLDNADKLADAIETKFIGEPFVLEAMAEIITSYLERDRLEDARRRIDQMFQRYPFQEETFWLSFRLGEPLPRPWGASTGNRTVRENTKEPSMPY